jgi:hypothetical protein
LKADGSPKNASFWLVRRGILLALLLLAGCPDSNKPGGDTAPVDSAVPMSGKIHVKPGPAKPVETKKPEETFPREKLVELYKAVMLGDMAVQKKYGLIDDDGKLVPARDEEFNEALKRFADEHPDDLTKLSEEIEAAQVTSDAPAAVEKK